jgi:hypothetical protein
VLQFACKVRGADPVAWYSVHIETPRGDFFADLTEDDLTEDDLGERLGDLLDALQPYHGSVGGGGEPVWWNATISIESATALAAVAEATAAPGAGRRS